MSRTLVLAMTLIRRRGQTACAERWRIAVGFGEGGWLTLAVAPVVLLANGFAHAMGGT